MQGARNNGPGQKHGRRDNETQWSGEYGRQDEQKKRNDHAGLTQPRGGLLRGRACPLGQLEF
jgi:hypothetical protein